MIWAAFQRCIMCVNQCESFSSPPVLEDIAEEGQDAVPELLVVPPPPPRKLLPEPESLGPAFEKPDGPSSVHMGEMIPPPEDNGTTISYM